MDKDLARFLIAAKTYLYNEKMKNPEINIFDHEVPKEEVACIARMSEDEAEEAAKCLQEKGLIHVFICDGKFGSCKVASLAFDKLDEFMRNYRRTP
ncbi:MAG: hypothetical protein K6T29_01810 [Peptococcaceae bacterium]|nr:hypothetical protein [Peptococcaceae bacterium]